MGEDRTAVCVDKRANQNEVMTIRHRNPSSVISSSCSEDAESESVGHVEDEDREQELEYGPGIVSKLKTRFMSISLKQNRGLGMRRSCSMENLLEQERPNVDDRGFVSKQQENGIPASTIPNSNWGHLKRAKSMDTLLLELETENCQQQEDCVSATCKKSGIRRRELSRIMPTICDEELPKPDTVKIYKRMFEPAESKRGSHCRKPPVLRASAKSGAMSGSAKPNGTNVSAKSSVLATKNKFISAKQSNVIKSHPVANTPITECSLQKPIVNGYNVAKPFVNGDNQVKLILSKQEKPLMSKHEKPLMSKQDKPLMSNKDNKMKNLLNSEIKEKSLLNGVRGTDHQSTCNGKIDIKSSEVKPQSVNNIGHTLCNGKSVEQELNTLNSNPKKEVYFAQVKDVICNRSYIKKDPVKVTKDEVIHKKEAIKVAKEEISYKKEAIKQTSKEIATLKKDPIKATSREETVAQSNIKMVNHLEGQNYKPKVPPNKPTVLKSLKPNLKLIEPRKPVLNERKPASPTKLKNKLDKSSDATKSKPVLNGELLNSSKSEKEESKSLEINNHKNVDALPPPVETKPLTVEEEFIKVEKLPEKLIVDAAQEHKIDVVDNSKFTNDTKPDSPEIKKEKPVLTISAPKKTQGSGNINGAATSMVFDFRGKDVVPQVALLPVPFGCKALNPKKRPLLIDGKNAGESFTNGLGGVEDDTDEEFVDYSVPPPSGVVFEGENVKIGRGSILATRNKDLKIKFDDEVDKNTFVYPSEVSLLEDTERCGSPDKEIISNGQSPASKLKSNTSIGSTGVGGFSSYTPSVLRTMDNFQPGMFRPAPQLPVEEEKIRNTEGEEENTEVREKDEDMLKPADPDLISSWSLSAGTSDLLF